MNKYLITGYEWFDKTNGNSYFSCRIEQITKEGTKLIAKLPFQYGYGEHYRQQAYKQLVEMGKAKEEDRFNHDLNHKRFIFVKHENQLKREVLRQGI